MINQLFLNSKNPLILYNMKPEKERILTEGVYFCVSAVLGSRCSTQAFLWLRPVGAPVCSGAHASRCGGFSCCGARALRRMGISSCGTLA